MWRDLRKQKAEGRRQNGYLRRRRAMLRGHRDLKVYQLAYKLAMEIFSESKRFPENERYSLTSQIRRSLRSVAANISEGFRKTAVSEHVCEQTRRFRRRSSRDSGVAGLCP